MQGPKVLATVPFPTTVSVAECTPKLQCHPPPKMGVPRDVGIGLPEVTFFPGTKDTKTKCLAIKMLDNCYLGHF